ncbi:hypothetical protein [Corynebacterium sp. NML130628]|uniref:hypothetical protein n=1 Tax=Corynebacterium sp. NML130628 TaxID=1906333 RepID=UPI0008FBBC9B|nr:hypothetical protein [Corynebacterium sp. NML130628]OIR40230.1 hypothetical protein BJP07_09725 [Corynebacterium sp. NML130628]
MTHKLFSRASAATLTILAPLTFTACSSETDTPPVITITQTTVVEEPSSSNTADTATPPAKQPAQHNNADACAQLPNDPREAYPSNSTPGRMPADDGSDSNYWIEDIDNAYDPCQRLSWIIFRGSLGDKERPAGTGASITDGVAFYVDGKPVKEMKAFGRVDSITPLKDDGAIFAWSGRGDYTAEGFVNHYSAEIRVTDAGIAAVSGDTEKFHEHWDYRVSYLLGTYD